MFPHESKLYGSLMNRTVSVKDVDITLGNKFYFHCHVGFTSLYNIKFFGSFSGYKILILICGQSFHVEFRTSQFLT